MPLSPPPRDPNGAVQPHDHDEITTGDGVIRRVSQQFIATGADGQPRVSSMALQPSSELNGGMSVDLERSIAEAGIDPRAFVTTPIFMGSVRFEAGQLRAEDMKVGFHPVPGNDHHGEVWGSFSKGKRARLLKIAQWFVAIEGVALSSAG